MEGLGRAAKARRSNHDARTYLEKSSAQKWGEETRHYRVRRAACGAQRHGRRLREKMISADDDESESLRSCHFFSVSHTPGLSQKKRRRRVIDEEEDSELRASLDRPDRGGVRFIRTNFQH